MVNNFQLVLFYKYAELLKRRFGENFQLIVSTDDYMPMPVPNREQYEQVLDATWFVDERPPEEIRYASTSVVPGQAYGAVPVANSKQLSHRITLFKNVPSLLRRHQEICRPVPPLYPGEL